MMNFMCPTDPGQVTVVTFESLKPVMDKPVVKNEIDDTIDADASTNPKPVVQS